MGAAGSRAVVLDAGALIALERADPRVRALVRLAALHGRRLLIPTPVVAQVWRDGSRQVALSRLLKMEVVETPTFDMAVARSAGALCGKAGTDDVIDAMVVLIARREGASVVTSDVGDLEALDPTLELHAL